MTILYKIFGFLVALGVLIVVHELGHYLVARWCNVKVLRFSIGFGKPLWARRFGPDRTEWALSAIPLGGYVKMVDEREGPVAPEDLPRAFNRQNVWKRIAVVIAGPLANFLLAIALYWGLFVGGIDELKPLAGAPVPESIADRAGVREGDTIVAVNGETVRSWQDVRWHVLRLAMDGEDAVLELNDERGRPGRAEMDLSALNTDDPESDLLAGIGLRAFRPTLPPVIGAIEAGSPADKAGLQHGDRIVAIDGRAVPDWSEFVDRVREAPDREVRVDLERAGNGLTVGLTPQRVDHPQGAYGRVGLGPRVEPAAMAPYLIEVRYGPIAALSQALHRTWETSIFSLRMMGKMLIGEVSWRNLSGPVTIADYAGQSAELGLVPFLTFLALISISLGVLNLLPIPLLDGGHLMYYTVEIFKGSPVSDRIMELGQRAGLAVLLVLMVFAFYNDISRLLTG